jgi:acetyl esterase/lipase
VKIIEKLVNEMSETSDMIRKMFYEGDQKRDAGLKTPDSIQRYDDILYGADTRWQILDVYRPKEADGKMLPVIVSVHGGGWVYGDKETYQFYCMDLARRGFAVVNFTYRLAPENKFPASIEDTNLVFSWVLDHAETYGFNKDHIFAVGDSAGAHILGLYSAICTNPDYASQYPFKVPGGFAPKAIALNCGAFHMEYNEESDDKTQSLIGEYLPLGGTLKELQRISVEKYVTANYPSVFLMTSVGDFLKNQAPVMAEKLAECNVPFLYRLYGSEKNCLGHVFHCDIKSEDARICNDEECFFFKEFTEKGDLQE